MHIVLDRDDVTELFNWHGGQGSAVYSLASTGLEHRVSVEMIVEAVNELQRDLTREQHYLAERDLAPADRADVEARIESLLTLMENLEVTAFMSDEEREGNPIAKERAKELLREAREKGVALGRRGIAKANELAGRAAVQVGAAYEKLKAEHVKTVNGETCVCARKDNPAIGSSASSLGSGLPSHGRKKKPGVHRESLPAPKLFGIRETEERLGRALTPEERYQIEKAMYRLGRELVHREMVHAVRAASGESASERRAYAAEGRMGNPRDAERFPVYRYEGANKHHLEGAFDDFFQARRFAEGLVGDPVIIVDRHLQSGAGDVVWRSTGAEGHHRFRNPADEAGLRALGELGRRMGKEEIEKGLVVAVVGDGELYGASRSEGASSPRYWQQLRLDNEPFVLFHARGVPDALAARIEATGTSEQFYSDGYDAMNAVAEYLDEEPFYVSHAWSHGQAYDEGARESNPSGREERLMREAHSASAEVQQAGEMLAIAVTSEGTLYPVRKQTEALLKKKMEKGTYSKERAPQAFAFYIEEGARLLAKENQKSGEDKRPWFDQYPAAVRRIAAADVAESVEAELRIAMRERDETAETRAMRSPAEGGRRDSNPIYPALGPAPERRENPTSSGGETVPLKLLQPEVGRASNPAPTAASVSKAVERMVKRVRISGAQGMSIDDMDRRVLGSALRHGHLERREVKVGGHEETRIFLPSREGNPLEDGCSKEAISANIEHELHKHPEMPVAQGVAIAYSHARAQGCRLPARRKHNPTADVRVADEILAQMGGMRTLSVMVGAKNFVALENGVQFSIGSGAKDGINKVRIVLRPSDTYDVEFWKVRGTSMKKVSEWGDVYNDQLMDLFEKETGMYLTMARRKNGEAAS